MLPFVVCCILKVKTHGCLANCLLIEKRKISLATQLPYLIKREIEVSLNSMEYTNCNVIKLCKSRIIIMRSGIDKSILVS